MFSCEKNTWLCLVFTSIQYAEILRSPNIYSRSRKGGKMDFFSVLCKSLILLKFMFTLLQPVQPIFCLMSNRKLMGKGCFLRSPYWTRQVIACFRLSPGEAASKSLSAIQIHCAQLQDAILSWFTQGNFNYTTHLSFSVAPLNLAMQR